MRLSFSYYDLKGFDIGVERLYKLFRFMEKDKLLIAVQGGEGKLGLQISQAIDAKDNMYLLEKLDRSCLLYYADIYSVIIDVSRLEGTRNLLTNLLSKNIKVPVIIGTTGDLPMDLIKEYSKVAPVSIVPNFSSGIPEIINAFSKINTEMWDISIIEKHHVNKVDAPSGTALALKKALNTDCFISSIREGSIIGEHTIIFDNKNHDERFIVEHQAKTRNLFANGALDYCSWIIKQKAGLYFSRDNNIKFSKYTGCGNDFIIIDNSNYIFDKVEFVQKYCQRGISIGADGVIFVSLVDKSDTIVWEYYNKDGTTVKMCGNGARCVVQYALDNGYKLTEHSKLLNNHGVETKIVLNASDQSFSVMIVDNYATLIFNKPLCGEDYGAIIDMVVPHAVIRLFGDELTSPNSYGTVLRSKGYDVNANIYIKKNNKLYVRTFERGIYDETLACGTGCCAVAYYEFKKEMMTCGAEIEYELCVQSGDSLFVKICKNTDGTCRIYLRGPAEKVFSGEIKL